MTSQRHRPVRVLIPARDERHSIGATLEALLDQRDLDGSPYDCGNVEITVFANGCTDDTAAIVRSFQKRFGARLQVIEEAEAPTTIGALRKRLFDDAADRASMMGRPDALLVSLDADTIASQTWIATLLREATDVDALAGHVTIGEPERVSPAFARIYRRFLAHGDLLARLQSSIDPRDEDPYPRHGAFVGASFAVTASAYGLAGGMPAIGQFEDRSFESALGRIDAKIRHSLCWKSWTSARRQAKVVGGFGTLLAHLERCGLGERTFTVPDPRRAAMRFQIDAAIRRLWHERPLPRDSALLQSTFDLTRESVTRTIRCSGTAGLAIESFDIDAIDASADEVPIDEANAILLGICRLREFDHVAKSVE